MKTHPKVYVVSLARATDRRKTIREQLSRYGIDFAFVDAVDAAEVGEDYLRSHVDEAVVLRSMKRRLSAPEVACALSHRLVYQDIVAGKYPGGVVLEDDAIVTPLFAASLDFFGKIGREIQDKWIVYNLEVMSRRFRDYLVLKRRSVQAVNELLFFAERVDWLSVEAHGAAGYYITAGAAQQFTDGQKVLASADVWSFHARRGKGRILVSVPSSIEHPLDQTSSYLENSRIAEETLISSTHNVFKKLFLYVRGGVRARFIKYIARPVVERLL